MSEPSRRTLLASAGVAAGLGAAGLAGPGTAGATRNGSAGAVDGDEEWPLDRLDPAGTAAAPDRAVPGDGVRVRWRAEVADAYPAAPTPLVVDGTVYAAGGALVAVDAATGRRRFAVGSNYRAPMAAAAARAYRRRTLVTADAFEGLRGLDAGGGVPLFGRRLAPVRWRVDSPEGSPALQLAGFDAAAPGTPTAAAGVVYVPAARGGLVALDASSGAVRWRSSDDGPPVTRPALRDRLAYVGQYGGTVRALDVADGSERWRASVPERRVLAPTALADAVVVPDRTGVTALDPGSGDRLWRHRLEGADVDAPVAATEGTVVVATELGVDGLDGVLALDAATGERRWSRPDVDARRAPTVAGGAVLVPAGRGVRALSLADGTDLWRHRTGIPPSTVSVAGGRVFVVAEALLALEAAA